MRLLRWLSSENSCNSDLIGHCAKQYTNIVYLKINSYTDIVSCKYYCIVYSIQV